MRNCPWGLRLPSILKGGNVMLFESSNEMLFNTLTEEIVLKVFAGIDKAGLNPQDKYAGQMLIDSPVVFYDKIDELNTELEEMTNLGFLEFEEDQIDGVIDDYKFMEDQYLALANLSYVWAGRFRP